MPYFITKFALETLKKKKNTTIRSFLISFTIKYIVRRDLCQFWGIIAGSIRYTKYIENCTASIEMIKIPGLYI